MVILISAMEEMILTVGTELLPSNEKLISIEKVRLDIPIASK
jgi:hypothetical protein